MRGFADTRSDLVSGSGSGHLFGTGALPRGVLERFEALERLIRHRESLCPSRTWCQSVAKTLFGSMPAEAFKTFTNESTGRVHAFMVGSVNPSLRIEWLGRVRYEIAHQTMVKTGTPAFEMKSTRHPLHLEHEPVYTLGRRRDASRT